MNCDLVIGIGEIGGPLSDLLSLKRNVIRKDVEPLTLDAEVETMHVCFPYSKTFVGTVLDYMDEFMPGLTIIHSTVVPGTTRLIAEKIHAHVAYSPMRGRHAEMHRDLVRYTKFIAAPNRGALHAAVAYFDKLKLFRIRTMSHSDALELAKLVSTSYFGLLVAWAQEISRYCEAALNRTFENSFHYNSPILNANYNEVMRFIQESENLPPAVFHPGHIKGHCIMPNLDLLEAVRPSPLIDAIRWSNENCTEEQKADTARHRPRRIR